MDTQLAPNPRLAVWLSKVLGACLWLSIVLIPLFFLPITLDALELNKQTLLIFLVGTATIAWLGQAIALRRLSLSRSWLHLVVLVFWFGYALSSFFSLDRYLSLAGNYGQMHWAFVSVTGFVLMYFLLVNSVKGTTKLYHLILAFLASSTVVAVYAIFQLFGIFPLGWLSAITKAQTFNTIGTINGLGVYLTVPLVIAASLTVLGCKDEMCVLGKEGKKSWWAKVLVWASLISTFAVAVLVDFWVIWAGILFGTVLLVLVTWLRQRRISHPMKMIVPAVLIVVSVCLLLFKTPLKIQLPGEVSPSAAASWSIARQALQERPLTGSGPGTWIYDYSKYRSPAVNMSQFWTVRFERSLSTFFTLLATIGLIGMGVWMILILSGVIKSVTHLVSERNDDVWQAYLTVFAGWATLVFLAFLYNYTFTHHFLFWFLFALLASLINRSTFTWDASSSMGKSAVLSLSFLFLCIAMVSAIWLGGQRLVADARYAQAVTAFRSGQPIDASIKALQTAATLNPLNDAYFRNLSQAYLIKAGQEFQTPASDERRTKVDSAIRSSIEKSKQASMVSPANVDNWANTAIVMQSIASFTAGADEQAIAMFQEALVREPSNPAFLNEIGRMHILRSDAYRQQLQSSEESKRKEAEQQIKLELEKAAETLNSAIQAKPDYAPAHYALGVVYERQNRLKDAITKLEQVLQVSSKDVGIGFQLAILYYRNGEKDKALNLLEQIVALDASYANARWYLSALYEERGRLDDAIAQVKKIQETYPNEQAVNTRLDSLLQAQESKKAPPVQPIPEPISENIEGPPQLNEVQKP